MNENLELSIMLWRFAVGELVLGVLAFFYSLYGNAFNHPDVLMGVSIGIMIASVIAFILAAFACSLMRETKK